MAKYKTCLFCNRNDSPLTREHVFPTWIIKEFTNADLWTNVNVGPKPFPSHKALGLVCKKVCDRCHHGWMHDLEVKGQPILSPLIRGLSTALTPDDQRTITHWFFKIVVMFDSVLRQERSSHFTVSERVAFSKSLAMPEITVAFLAYYILGTIGDIATRHGDLMPFSPELVPEPDRYLLDSRGHSLTVLIQHLTLQIFSFREPKNAVGKWVIPSKWNDAQTIIWPVRPSASWPPRLLLDDKGFEAFATRFEDFGLMS